MTAHDFTLTDINGKEFSLSKFKGKKILLVNTASACGYTPQYRQLQELHENFSHKIVVLGLPCNDFGDQEPGTENEILQFCEVNFGVTFLLTQKVNILGNNPHPLYNYLMKKELNGYRDSEVRWNFQKYLISGNGVLIKIFGSAVDPLSEDVLKMIDTDAV